MNIFVTSRDPVKAAMYLDDQRVVKMATESIQMLFTCIDVMCKWEPTMFRPQQPNHPCTVWVRQAKDNFLWLYEHALALEAEWQFRWGHTKQQAAVLRFNQHKGWRHAKNLPKGSTPFVNCAANKEYDLDFKHIDNVHKAYRLYLKARWRFQQDNAPRTRLPQCSIRL